MESINKSYKKYLPAVIMFIVFETVAVTLWLTKGNIFYLFNFSYLIIFCIMQQESHWPIHSKTTVPSANTYARLRCS